MKKVWILVSTIMILFTCYQITNTYAKYVSEISGNAEEDIGTWKVKVNGTEITTGTIVQEFTIDSMTYNSNNNVLAGKIAPGLEGYFDIEIDATGASVAVIYDVTIHFDQIDISDAIKFSKLVKVVDGQETQEGITSSGESTYTGIISLDDVKNGKKTTVRVYVEWELDTTGASDEEDSALGLTKNLKVEIPVEVKASQYTG